MSPVITKESTLMDIILGAIGAGIVIVGHYYSWKRWGWEGVKAAIMLSAFLVAVFLALRDF